MLHLQDKDGEHKTTDAKGVSLSKDKVDETPENAVSPQCRESSPSRYKPRI